MEFQSRILVCQNCGEEFVFTADAQRYFYERGKKRDPRTCKACHLAEQRPDGRGLSRIQPRP
jgi:hypothetical protein